MYSIQEQFKTDALAQMNGRVLDAQRIAGNILDLSREIGVLNVRTTKASAEHLAGAMQKLLSASNPGEFMQLAASAMQPDMQLWTGYVTQLQGIAGKVSLPASPLLAPITTLLAPLAAAVPKVTWPTAAATAPEDAVQTAPAVEAPAVPEEAQLEAAIADVPAAPPPAAVPYAVGMEEETPDTPDTAEASPPAAASTPPETVEAIKEVAEAMSGTHKAPPAVMAASTPPAEAPAVPEIKVVHKNAVAQSGRKQVAPPAAKKAAVPVRSAPNRARKG
jgi:hypothetical protein